MNIHEKTELQWKPFYDSQEDNTMDTKRTDIIIRDAWNECILFNDLHGLGSKLTLADNGKIVTVSQPANVIVHEPFFICSELNHPIHLSDIS